MNQDLFLKRSWLNTALLYLFIVGLLGAFLRFLIYRPLTGINFKYLLHAHSHTALLGWVYAALFVALLQSFLPVNVAAAKKYKRLFWLTQFAVLGMLCSFPVQGYAAVSITFSTLHILLSYAFVYYFTKDLKQVTQPSEKPVSVLFLKAAFLFLVISSFGPFSLGPIMVSGDAGNNLYYLAIYYYLHFQYNGWFTFAIFAILFKWWERSGFVYSQRLAKIFFWLMFSSCFLAYSLSALWAKPAAFVYYIATIAGIMQCAALLVFGFSFFHIWQGQKMLLPKLTRFLITISFLAFSAKLVLQLISALPEMANLAYMVREFVIGYLHLVLLGFVSFFLFGYFLALKAWQGSSIMAKSGLLIFVSAFIITELLIFMQGFFYWQYSYAMPNYALLLFMFSLFLPLGIGLFLAGQLRLRYAVSDLN